MKAGPLRGTRIKEARNNALALKILRQSLRVPWTACEEDKQISGRCVHMETTASRACRKESAALTDQTKAFIFVAVLWKSGDFWRKRLS